MTALLIADLAPDLSKQSIASLFLEKTKITSTEYFGLSSTGLR